MTNRSPYDKEPCLRVRDGAGKCVAGWESAAARLARDAPDLLVVECYPGVHVDGIIDALRRGGRWRILDARALLLDPAAIEALVLPGLTDDPVFGQLSLRGMEEFLDPARLEAARAEASAPAGPLAVVGPGASLVSSGGVLVMADLPRWEAQLRFRRGESGNLGAANAGGSPSALYKRAFFVDWRVADRVKRRVLPKARFLLDTTIPGEPRLVEGDAFRAAIRQAATQPFRVVPFFDPAPWGGEWMRDRFGLDPAAPNYGWGFDCVPEENSLYLDFDGIRVEVPSIDVVFMEPVALLGHGVHARFGDEFPIRTDFLDTMRGGNLSFQVHPTTEHIQRHFGMHYTQDESYYILDADEGSHVYLGVKPGCDPAAMADALRRADAGGAPFPADDFSNRLPSRKHDHFLIPAGTVHCSGAGTVVLEISATPYIFTFKLWDWGRLGLDGKPRPTHIGHGEQVIDATRDTEWVQRELVNAVVPVAEGDGWREEKTGLHEREFIETRRFWFRKETRHDTRGNLNVLNLVEGDSVLIESPGGRFDPIRLNYAETIIVPAAVGPYTVRPADGDAGREHALLKIFVRTGLPGGVSAGGEPTDRPPRG